LAYQPAVLFSHNKPATSNQPSVLFSQNKSAPAISHQPNEHAVESEAIRGAIDFIGINHYYSFYVNDHPLEKGIRDFLLDVAAEYRGKSISRSIQD
jgi:hypothetical protein